MVTLGGLVGIGELIARYKDDPFRAVQTPAAVVYVLINSGASAGALYLTHAFNWDFGQKADAPKAILQALVAGFGAMVLFRSSLFTVRVGDSDVAVGPSSFLQVVLDAADRSVDRVRAHARATSIGVTMDGISYDVATVALPVVCLALMQNVSQLEQQNLAVALNGIRDQEKVDPRVKVVAIGLKLQNVVGQEVLDEATKLIRTILKVMTTMELVAALAVGASNAAKASGTKSES